MTRISRIRALETVQVMTLLLVLAPGPGKLNPLLGVLALIGLLARPLRESPWLWLTVALARAADHFVAGWYLVDNHHYLLTYWCLALALTLISADPPRSLRTNARLLIGACFAFAGAWKVIGAQYLNGSFLVLFLVSTPRINRFLPGMEISPDVIESNRTAIAQTGTAADSASLVLPLEGVTATIETVAIALGVWTIGIEFVIAGLFLLPLRRPWSRLGDLALVAFVLTTYVLAPVLIFGLLLVTMAFARLTSDDVGWRSIYLLAFISLPPVVFSALGQPLFGFILIGVGFLFGYINGWGRWMLIAGLFVLAGTFAIAAGLLADPVASLALATGSAVISIAGLDLLFGRRTDRWLLAFGGVAFATATIVDALTHRWLLPVAAGSLAALLWLASSSQKALRGKPDRG